MVEVAPSLRMWRTLVRVEKATNSYLEFTLPASTWDHVFWVSRYELPPLVDEAIDYGQPYLHVHANVGADDWSRVRFDFWEAS